MKEDWAFVLRRVLSLLVDFGVEAPRKFHRIDDDERESVALLDPIENLGGKSLGVFARFLAA